MMTITCITFDWGDTLAANYGMPYDFTQQRAIEHLGHDLRALGGRIDASWSEQAYQELHNNWLWTVDADKNPDHKECDIAGMVRNWVVNAGLNEHDDAVQQAIRHLYKTCTDIVLPYGGSLDTLKQLKSDGYRIGILSHVAWPVPACLAWFERWGFARYLDFYSLSSGVGYIKPSPKHYQDTLDQAGCPAHAILHVGDHPERDIEGARAFGFKTVLRQTDRIYSPTALAHCQPDARIAQVCEIPSLLEQWT